MTKIIKQITLAFITLTFSLAVWATTLEQAKSQGLVGEMANGYLGVVIASQDTKKLVDQVNEKRKTLYQKLAQKNNLTMTQMTLLAGEKSIKKTKAGHLIQNSAGQWIKKTN